jgi:DNA-binding NarL/FixJ family response regulator
MASIPISLEGTERPRESSGDGQFIRVIVADTQAIFRAGLRKIFAVEDDIRVVGQAENLTQTLAAARRFSADLLILEAALTPNPAECPGLRMVVVTPEPDEELTLELFRRGVHGVVSREVEPELLIDCVRKVAKGEPWLDSQGIQWVLEAYRTQGTRPLASRSKVQLTPKESLIVGCVTQGMKNKEIALRVGTTEQVVKNYLRKVYDKLGVADRLELALYCLHNRVVDVPPGMNSSHSSSGNGSALAASAGAAESPGKVS